MRLSLICVLYVALARVLLREVAQLQCTLSMRSHIRTRGAPAVAASPGSAWRAHKEDPARTRRQLEEIVCTVCTDSIVAYSIYMLAVILVCYVRRW